MLIHGEKTFGCVKCESKFSRKGDLTRHFKSKHVKKKPFTCDKCVWKFSRKDDFERHVRIIHKNL